MWEIEENNLSHSSIQRNNNSNKETIKLLRTSKKNKLLYKIGKEKKEENTKIIDLNFSEWYPNLE